MRGGFQRIWLALATVTAVGVLVSWYLSEETGLTWWRLLGLGLSVLFLILVWLWPGDRQPNQPPP